MKDKKLYWAKIILIGIIIIGWIILISLRFATDISLKIPFIISIVLSIILLVFLFWKNIKKLFKKSEENKDMPKPVDKERLNEIMEKTVNEMMDNISKNPPPQNVRTSTISKNLIYCFKVHLCLENKFIYIIINATYPDIVPIVLEEKDKENIDHHMNKISSNPKEEPDVIESEERVDAFGKPVRRVKETKHHRKEEKEEDKEESVI